MDFSEERIDYPGLKVEYMIDEFRVRLSNSPGYIIANYDGESFVEKLFELLGNRTPEEQEVQQYITMGKQGACKEAICYKMMEKLGCPNTVSQQTHRLYKKRFEETEWDISEVFLLDGQAFVNAVYQSTLERSPDEAGFVNYCNLLRAGVPKEAVVYMLGASDEARKRRRIKYLGDYKTIYDQYISRQTEEHSETKYEKLKRPLRTYEISKRIDQTLFELGLKNDYRNEQISNCLRHIMEQNDNLQIQLFELEKRFAEFQDKMENRSGK